MAGNHGPRCIGHGGMPVDLPGTVKTGHLGVLEFIDTRPYQNDEGLHVGVNGMVLLTIDGAELKIDYVDVHGESIAVENFSARAGGLARGAVTNRLLVRP